MTKLLKALLAAGMTLLGALQLSPVTAAPRVAEAELEAEAVLLVAHPHFRDPIWLQTVLLVAPLLHGGHVGVIINRPTTATLGKLFPDHASSQKVDDAVYYGGPFATQVLVALVKSDASPGHGSFALTKELFLTVDGPTIDRVIEQRPEAARYYLGLVLWQPGELKRELAMGLWSVHHADAGTVLRKDMAGLWEELTRTTQGLRVQAPALQLAAAR